LGGEQFLPFARSCVAKLKKLGLPYADQSYEIDGVSVKVRIEPGHEYIRLEGGEPPYVLIVFRLRTAGIVYDNEDYDLYVYRVRIPNFGAAKLVQVLPGSFHSTYYPGGTWPGLPMTRNTVLYTFAAVFKGLPVYLKETYALIGGNPLYDGAGGVISNGHTERTDTEILHGTTVISTGFRTNTTEVFPYYFWYNTALGVWERGLTVLSPYSPAGFSLSGYGINVTNARVDMTENTATWNLVSGVGANITTTKTYTLDPIIGNPSIETVTEDTPEGAIWTFIDLDPTDKIKAARKANTALIPHSYGTTFVPLSATVIREDIDFKYRAVFYGDSGGIADGVFQVVGCCKTGFYTGTTPITLKYYKYADGLNDIPIPALDFADLVNAGIDMGLGNPQFFDDYIVYTTYHTDTMTPTVNARGVGLASFSRTTGKLISAAAISEVPLADSYWTPVSSANTRYKRLNITGFPTNAPFVKIMRDEFANM